MRATLEIAISAEGEQARQLAVTLAGIVRNATAAVAAAPTNGSTNGTTTTAERPKS